MSTRLSRRAVSRLSVSYAYEYEGSENRHSDDTSVGGIGNGQRPEDVPVDEVDLWKRVARTRGAFGLCKGYLSPYRTYRTLHVPYM